MKNFMKFFMVLALGAVICLPGVVSATQLTNTSSFGPGTVTEGFEGVTPGSTNTSSLFNGSWFNINVTPPYDFGNGVSLLAPAAVSPTTDNTGPYIHDFTYGAGTADQIPLGGATITSAPFDKAYLGIWRDANAGPFDLIFKFDQDVIRAGAYFTGYPEADTLGTQTYYIKALDASGNVLASYIISAGTVGNWANQFVGIELLSGFRELDFSNPTYGQTVLDNLMFESDNQVPLPASALLLGTGLLGLVGLRWRKVKAGLAAG